MEKEILYKIATDNNGNYFHIDNAEKGKNYYCPICKDKFILRKSGNTGKGSKRPHFAHNELSPSCTQESILHKSFKKELIKLLEIYKSENKIFKMDWNCNICNNKYSGILLDKVDSIKEEYNLKVCQPDIALLDEKENVIAAIEIVVTHAPEENALEYYKMNNIILIQINLSSDEDFKKLEKKIATPDIVNFCFKSNCQKSKDYNPKQKFVLYTEKCRKCSQPINIYCNEINYVFGFKNLIILYKNHLELLKSMRVSFEKRIDITTFIKNPDIICQGCKSKEFQKNQNKGMKSRPRRKPYYNKSPSF